MQGGLKADGVAHVRVHAIEGVRVADALVMPRTSKRNTLAAWYMTSEKAVDMLLEQQSLHAR